MGKKLLFGALLGAAVLATSTGCAGYYTYSGHGGYLHGRVSVTAPDVGVYVPAYPPPVYHHYYYPYPRAYPYYQPYYRHYGDYGHYGHEFREHFGHEGEHHEHHEHHH